MNDVDGRLMRCFTAVFPGLTEAEIRTAARDSTEQWDSLGSLLLAQTIEEEFGIKADLELLDQLSSFENVRQFVAGRVST
jgi:acyl carrier protein